MKKISKFAVKIYVMKIFFFNNFQCIFKSRTKVKINKIKHATYLKHLFLA